MYIDLEDFEKNKYVFDELQRDRSAIEAMFDEPVSWETKEHRVWPSTVTLPYLTRIPIWSKFMRGMSKNCYRSRNIWGQRCHPLQRMPIVSYNEAPQGTSYPLSWASRP